LARIQPDLCSGFQSVQHAGEVVAVMLKVGERIRGFRVQRGLSQGDIEQRTGLLRCYLSRVENGHTTPSLQTLAKIARALDVPLAHFFIDVQENGEPPMVIPRLSGEELAFLTQIQRYASVLNDNDRKLVLAMIKKMAVTAPVAAQ
jgi:transcriptional regulator with XRE-family HTH domain